MIEENKTSTRISLTLPIKQVELLDKLVDAGIYINRGQIILEGIRNIFNEYGLIPSMNCIKDDSGGDVTQ